jgi:hypothetical protein
VRRSLTTRFVLVISLLIVAVCAGWAVLAQVAVPDACTYHPPPPHAQYLHCP